ncbi:hypothetical protein OMW55_00010 [Sphingomonas sp. BN140010]|uniref:Uncharacterized protein n=1 Tax=Sphingomonas arvum TaxID=2992113 RepID=A0ABT3JAV4_9SPHN|nr:hypothetical protein [Sphingomonas sp. BN140010]MCW3796193.1 hypothetical protein [Sphingomonas sp. BN140010]
MNSIVFTTFSIVSALALAGAVFFILRATRRAWRFVRLARSSSYASAMRRGRLIAHRQAYQCAVDVHYYLSRIALMFCSNLLASTGILFAAIGLTAQPETGGKTSLQVWQQFAAVTLFILVIFMGWSFTRTINLARRVLRMRRDLRAAAVRKRKVDATSGASWGEHQPHMTIRKR